ncbi:MAG: hypothetical protein ACKOTF_07670 [Opitutaceae bacterium]
MKTFAAALIALITAVCVVAAQPAGKALGKTAEPAKIAGMEIARPGKGFIGLEVDGGNFRLTFYDENREPVKPAASRAVLRWTPANRAGAEFYALDPSADGKVLTSPKTVRPPYQFKMFLSLFAAGADAPFESHTVDFRQ